LINKLEALARIEGGLVLIILVFLLIGVFAGILLGFGVGYIIGRITGKKIRILSSSIGELSQALSGLRVKIGEKQSNSNVSHNPDVRFKKFPV
jgi:hypothetical protein